MATIRLKNGQEMTLEAAQELFEELKSFIEPLRVRHPHYSVESPFPQKLFKPAFKITCR